MLSEQEGVELRGWRTVSVTALRGRSTGVPHFPQNSLSRRSDKLTNAGCRMANNETAIVLL
jgi:hypothetical protein